MNDIFSDHIDPSRDAPNIRTMPVEDGAAFVLSQKDPHGFWFITREHGQVPEHLSGSYTDVKFARQAVEAYLLDMKKPRKAKE